ncbi:N-acetylmuramoyl-L-alanine amidase [Myceligenerans pegani]|uniref:N-acetylmuramoyl-L-alanine amidase n=1 Tax=Myceligenerans pegani TaxID=2776917 RepID=A0ABR9N589_9MICO|nr:N-acetylmuramoyl-L-alanine amidase [Myceligenerans sp. TRM 65318]MBE1878837.1 N-acetylmuramoyl-L-alanine amidase [Myceligenerans sp. TRM 65318]MBE3021108.1 N-acetylmuramoyl-L-alanine amidase [Myceligenerans sp. TRM 65318]
MTAALASSAAPYAAASTTEVNETESGDACASVIAAGSLDEAFDAAAASTGVPAGLLKAVSYLESRWDQHGGRPSVEGGYGLFNLDATGYPVGRPADGLPTTSHFAASHVAAARDGLAADHREDHHHAAAAIGAVHDADVAPGAGPGLGSMAGPGNGAGLGSELARAASLAGVSVTDVKNDQRINLCAGATLLASYQTQAVDDGVAAPESLPRPADVAHRTAERSPGAAGLAEWEVAVSRMNDSETFPDQVYELLRSGVGEVTPDGDTVILEGDPSVVVPGRGEAAEAGSTTAEPSAPDGAATAVDPDCPATIDCEWLPAPYEKHDPDAPGDTTDYGNHDQAERTGTGGPSLDYIVIHDTEGSYQSSVNLVLDPEYLGWHYTIRSEDGHVAHHVENEDVGWHAGNWYMNMHSIGIEHEGFAGTAGWYTEAMYRSSAELVKYLAERYDIPLDRAHVIGHDQIPGILEGYTRNVHWDPGPYWDWDHYFELLGAPIGGDRPATTDVSPGDVVEVRTGYTDNPQEVTGCGLASPGSGPCVRGAGTNFLYLHQEPSSDAPLARDPGWKPDGSNGTTYASDISARVQSGHKLVVDEVDGEWLGVWWAGAKAWLHNPASRPVVVPTTAQTITVAGDEPAPVYGRAYPEPEAYAPYPGIPVQTIGALEYRIGVGQRYAVSDADVVTDYYRATTFDGTGPDDRTDVRGETRYYQVWLAHRQFFVDAADVELHEPADDPDDGDPGDDGDADDEDRITTTHWSGVRGLAEGTRENLRPGKGGSLGIRGAGPTREYTDPHGDGTPVEYETGTWTSPVVEPGYAIDESVTSWNATTPTGTWVEVEFRGRKDDGEWTKWFVMGRWASGADHAPEDGGVGDIRRTSVDGQHDDDAYLFTDTYVAKTGREPTAFQTRVTLYRPAGSDVTPRLSSVSTMTNEYLPDGRYEDTSEFTLDGAVELDVPGYSQLTHIGEYPEFGGGGQVWCSPTSTTMVMYSYGRKHQVPEELLEGITAPAGNPQVAYAAIHSWDHTYEGAGNWAFNTAYAHRFGLESFVTRLRSLAEAEKFVAAGIPLVVSVNFAEEEMPEAGYGTDGHLLTIVGFTEDGDPVVNDPNKDTNEQVRNVYTRENFERVWQTSTDGLTYVLHPRKVKLPPNTSGATPNW